VTDDELDAMVAVAHAHAEAEARGDMAGTMATLDPDPLYELLPIGLGLRGGGVVRRYYEHFFTNCIPLVTDFNLRSEWVNGEGVGQEYQLSLRGPTGSTRYDIIGILTFGSNGLLSGERIYASDELIHILFGPFLHHAFPLFDERKDGHSYSQT
jgi:hypothetical protein